MGCSGCSRWGSSCSFTRVGANCPRKLNLFRNLIELLAAIPSVVYGLWGLFVIIPLVRPGSHWLHA